MGFSYETSFRVTTGEVEKLIKSLLGNQEQQEERQKHFNEAAVKDATTFLESHVEHDAIPEKLWGDIKDIAISMYIRGFNQAFRYYIKQEDIFNLEDNGTN